MFEALGHPCIPARLPVPVDILSEVIKEDEDLGSGVDGIAALPTKQQRDAVGRRQTLRFANKELNIAYASFKIWGIRKYNNICFSERGFSHRP